jgi:hypothetical protein
MLRCDRLARLAIGPTAAAPLPPTGTQQLVSDERAGSPWHGLFASPCTVTLLEDVT